MDELFEKKTLETEEEEVLKSMIPEKDQEVPNLQAENLKNEVLDEPTVLEENDTSKEKEKSTAKTVHKDTRETPAIIEDDLDIVLTALTPSQTKERDWRLIKQAAERHTIMERQIIGVERAESDNATPRVYVLVHDFKVAISTRDFFGDGPFAHTFDKVSAGERNLREFQVASRMLGAYVPFVITDAESAFDEEKGERVYAVRASRQEALQRKKERYFFGKQPRVKVGDMVKARVLMSTPKGILMEVLGTEVIIPVAMLSSCKWVDPLYEYAPGTVTYVVVTELAIDRENKKVKLVASREPLDRDLADTSYNSVRIGMRYIGTVVGIDAQYVRINLDCHVRASAPVISIGGVRMRRGDRVSLAVTKKNDDRQTVYGSCLPIATRSI